MSRPHEMHSEHVPPYSFRTCTWKVTFEFVDITQWVCHAKASPLLGGRLVAMGLSHWSEVEFRGSGGGLQVWLVPNMWRSSSGAVTQLRRHENQKVVLFSHHPY